MHTRQYLLGQPEPRQQTVTTFWQGNIAAATWTHRNVASVTENGLADVTITFQQAYQASPSAIVTGGTGTNLQAHIVSLSNTSVRIITKNSSGTAVVARNSSLICAGDI